MGGTIRFADLADHAATARKSGAMWRIGAINVNVATELELKLDFLGPCAWRLHVWSDSTAASALATAVEESTQTVRKGDTIKVRLSPTGGYAAVLTSASRAVAHPRTTSPYRRLSKARRS